MKNQLCVSKAALAPDGPAPEIGDSVTIELVGTISKIDGDTYCIDAQTANGAPVAADMAEPTDEGMEDQMRGMAQASDEEAGLV